ncbi:MAG: hypothetical protein E6J82_06065 [Deltaproteobacteria bacterium]|nr:MAG: hypothetical protein E6J82_06065 [Deltaproteobacteria bacterium]
MKCSSGSAVLSIQMRATLLLLAAAAPAVAQAQKELPPESTFIRTAHAARRTGPGIEIDGRMDEPAWQAAPLHDGFTQVTPDEGRPATVRTAFRVLWDDEYLYFGAVCDDPEGATATLSRRDRFIEGDSVQFDLDTTFDRRTAYHFQVYAAGQQLDAIHFNDTDMTTDWDAAWDSAVAQTPNGWSVEMRIPLRVMRIPESAKIMGFNVYRILSRRKEEDQWRFRPQGRQGDISRLGLIDGIEGIRPVRELELRPYVGFKAVRNVPTYATPRSELGSCATLAFDRQRQGGVCAGLDFRYNLASDLALVGTVNPDFGQVEADQRVLNLTTFETFFPEKRPFFLEGLDLFKPALRADLGGPNGGDVYQIFYSRRIGRGTPTRDDLDLADEQKIVYQQPFVPVLGAVKMTGTVGSASVGLLTAFEPRVFAQVLQPGTPCDSSGTACLPERVDNMRSTEARFTSVARARTPLGDYGLAGVTATAAEPVFTSPSLGLTDRRHAHVGEGDLTLYTSDRVWETDLQGVASTLHGANAALLRDGTLRGSTSSGYALSGKLRRFGEHGIFGVQGDLLSPEFNVNDLGFMQRANLFRGMAFAGWRDPHPGPNWQAAQLILGIRELHDYSFAHRLNRDVFVDGWVNTNSFWFWETGFDVWSPFVDDRELEDGTPIERQANWQWFGYLSTDSRKPLQVQFYWTEGRSFPRFERLNQLGGTLVFRPMPRLDGTLDLAYNENAGTIRQIATPALLPGELDPTRRARSYVLAPQQARSLSATLRATYSFTPHLTLQAYGQLFTAGISYGNQLGATVARAGRPTVKLDQLVPLPPDQYVDANERQVGLNLNLILRWEWRTGSTFYLVYAHQSSNDLTSGVPRGLDYTGELSALSATGVAHGDTLLVKVDLLSAL